MKRLTAICAMLLCLALWPATAAGEATLDLGYPLVSGEAADPYALAGASFSLGAGFSAGPELGLSLADGDGSHAGIGASYETRAKGRVVPTFAGAYLWPLKDHTGFDQRVGLASAGFRVGISGPVSLRFGYRVLFYPDSPAGDDHRGSVFAGLALRD